MDRRQVVDEIARILDEASCGPAAEVIRPANEEALLAVISHVHSARAMDALAFVMLVLAAIAIHGPLDRHGIGGAIFIVALVLLFYSVRKSTRHTLVARAHLRLIYELRRKPQLHAIK